MTRRLRNEQGASLVEFALVFPIVFFVFAASVSFLWMLTARSAMTGAARDGARYASIRKDPLCEIPTDTWGRSCSADWPADDEVETYVRERAGRFSEYVNSVAVDRPNGAYPNAPVTVTVTGDIPVVFKPVAALLGFDDVVYSSEGKARDE